ncbi:XRE family transcriptional regulator [Prolixibacteraceae bacterium JC049]|nr:XRE family transcriptional regulator [Prolixibacteraceae bacterium JC049]
MIGQKIRELREENDFLLRQLAAKLDIDTAQLSKMERGERFFKKEEIIEISRILKADKQELLTIWLADKIYKTIKDEEYVFSALKLVEQKLQ